jgi:hypothetical protein
MPALSKRSGRWRIAAVQNAPQPRPAYSNRYRQGFVTGSASLRLDHIQRDAAFGVAVDLKLEVVVARTLKVKTEMLPDVNVCLRLASGNPNFKILAYRLENRPHVRIAEVHLDPVAALLAHIKAELACDSTQRMIAGKRASTDRVKRSQDVQFAASDRGGIAKRKDFSLHDEVTLAPKEKRECYPRITRMDAKKQLQSRFIRANLQARRPRPTDKMWLCRKGGELCRRDALVAFLPGRESGPEGFRGFYFALPIFSTKPHKMFVLRFKKVAAKRRREVIDW